MINIMRADIYRLAHGKAIYITFAVLAAFIVLVAYTQDPGTMGVQFIEAEQLDSSRNGLMIQYIAPGYTQGEYVYSGYNTPFYLSIDMDNLVFFLLPLIIITIAPMFSHGTVKNSLSCGTPRLRMYISKMLLCAGLCLATIVFYLLFGTVLATMMHGFGGSVSKPYCIALLKIYGSQAFMLLAVTCFGVAMVFLTRRTAVANSVYLAVFIIPQIVISILASNNENLTWLANYELIGSIKLLTYINSMRGYGVARALMVGVVYMAASTAAGIYSFRKCEIR